MEAVFEGVAAVSLLAVVMTSFGTTDRMQVGGLSWGALLFRCVDLISVEKQNLLNILLLSAMVVDG